MRAKLLINVVLVAYLAALPLYRVELLPLGWKVLVPADVIFLALVTAATVSGVWRRPASSLILAASLPPAATLVSAFATSTPWSSAAPEVARTAYSMLTLVVVASLRLDREQTYLATRTWTAIAAVVCMIGLVTYLGVSVFGLPASALARPNSPNLGPTVVRIAGLLETNALTIYLVLATGFSAFLARFGTSPSERRFANVALLLVVGTSLASASRGVIGVAVTLAALAFRAELACGWLRRSRAFVAGLAGLLAVAGAAATWWAIFPVSLAQRADGQRALQWNERPNAYRVLHTAGWRMFAAHPFVGVGPGRFGTSLATFTTVDERSAAWPPLDPRRNWSPHSAWIGSAAEGGLLLFSAWVNTCAVLAWLLLRRDAPAALARCLGLSLVGLIINGLYVDFVHLKFVWAGVGLGLTPPTERSREP